MDNANKQASKKLWKNLKTQKGKHGIVEQQIKKNSPHQSNNNSNSKQSYYDSQPLRKFNIHKIYTSYQNSQANQYNQHQDHNQQPNFQINTNEDEIGQKQEGKGKLSRQFGQVSKQIQLFHQQRQPEYDQYQYQYQSQKQVNKQSHEGRNFKQVIKKKSLDVNKIDGLLPSKGNQTEAEQRVKKNRRFSIGQQSVVQQIVDIKNFNPIINFKPANRNNNSQIIRTKSYQNSSRNSNAHNLQICDFQSDQQPLIMSLGSQSNPVIRYLKLSRIKDDVQKLQLLREETMQYLQQEKNKSYQYFQRSFNCTLAYVIQFYGTKLQQLQQQNTLLSNQVHALKNNMARDNTNHDDNGNHNMLSSGIKTRPSLVQEDTPKFARNLLSFTAQPMVEKVLKRQYSQLQQQLEQKIALNKKYEEQLQQRAKANKQLQQQVERLRMQNSSYIEQLDVLQKQNQEINQNMFDYDQKIAQVQLEINEKVEKAVAQKIKEFHQKQKQKQRQGQKQVQMNKDNMHTQMEGTVSAQGKYYLTQIQKLQQQIEQLQKRSYNGQLKSYMQQLRSRSQRLQTKQKQLEQKQKQLQQFQQSLNQLKLSIQLRQDNIQTKQIEVSTKQILLKQKQSQLLIKEKEIILQMNQLQNINKNILLNSAHNHAHMHDQIRQIQNNNYNIKLNLNDQESLHTITINKRQSQLEQKNNQMNQMNSHDNKGNPYNYYNKNRKFGHTKNLSGQTKKVSFQDEFNPAAFNIQDVRSYIRPRNNSNNVGNYSNNHDVNPRQVTVQSYKQPVQANKNSIINMNMMNMNQMGSTNNYKAIQAKHNKSYTLTQGNQSYNNNWKSYFKTHRNGRQQIEFPSLQNSKQKEKQKQSKQSSLSKQQNKKYVNKTHQPTYHSIKNNSYVSKLGYNSPSHSYKSNIGYHRNNLNSNLPSSSYVKKGYSHNTNNGKPTTKSIDKTRLQDLGNKLQNLRNQIRKEIHDTQ